MSPEAPVQDPPAETTPSAPVEAAQDSVRSEERGSVTITEFLNPDASPKTETTPPAAEQAKAPDASAPQQAQPEQRSEPDDISDDDLKRYEKSAKAEARIQQLVNNRVGNILQREREKTRAEIAAEIDETRKTHERLDEAYQFLTARGREAFMREYGLASERDAAQWEADYLAEREQRGKPAVTAQADESIRTDFNNGAIGEFKAYITALPFYSELGDEYRKVIENAKFDPKVEGNWFGDSVEALLKGIAARDERRDREHRTALEEARTAGRNSALADREEASPVIINGSGTNPIASMSNFELNEAYNDGRITREQFNAENRRRGIDY